VVATQIDPDAHTVVCADGTTYSYDRLLVATGGIPAVPAVTGIRQDFVFTLRSLADAQRIKQFAQQCESVLVMGGGVLGIETAHALVRTGKQVTVIEFFPRLLPRQMDRDGAAVLQMALERLGLRSRSMQKPKQWSAIATGKESRSATDASLQAHDYLSAGITLKPRCSIRSCCKMPGIQVNDHMETGIADIYAAGDLVEHRNVVYGIWAAAKRQGKVAGANMAGSRERYKNAPSTILKVAASIFCLRRY
jgi:nitrite reductase (NADH) large subunit